MFFSDRTDTREEFRDLTRWNKPVFYAEDGTTEIPSELQQWAPGWVEINRSGEVVARGAL